MTTAIYRNLLLALFLTIFLNNSSSDAVFKKMAEKAKTLGKGAMDSYELGRSAYEAIGGKIIKEGFEMYCSHGGEGAEKFVKFVKCDGKHANEKYCEYANNGKMMFELLCEMSKEKGLEWFGKAMGCFKVKNKQDCFCVWMEELQASGDLIKMGAEQIGGK